MTTRATILAVLSAAGSPQTTHQLAEAVEKYPSLVNWHLGKLEAQGEVRREYGRMRNTTGSSRLRSQWTLA